jgi:hypothetical protein
MPPRPDHKPRNGDWLLLNSGQRYWPLDPRVGDFLIEDIAHGLSNICRWGGQTDKFYSVAEHSVLVSSFVRPELQLAALLHDAAEAFVGDVPRPLKRILGAPYQLIEDRTHEVIAMQFGIDKEMHPQIKEVDHRITVDERQQLFANNDDDLPWQFADGVGLSIDLSQPMLPWRAKQAFIQTYNFLVAR